MKIRVLCYLVLLMGLIGFAGCKNENTALKNEAKHIADVMCKSVEAMKNLRMADPADTLQVQKLQLEYEKVEAEMDAIYKEFRAKYSDKTDSKEFNEEFRKYLNESMLDCKSLSKEDRESFEKGAK
jgi:hypothetical protein